MSDGEFSIRVYKEGGWLWAWSDELDLGAGGYDNPLEALQEFNERLASQSVTVLVNTTGKDQ